MLYPNSATRAEAMNSIETYNPPAARHKRPGLNA
jgi:hypothetical protein